LIDEFFAADRYVLSVPMYNLSISAGLKSVTSFDQSSHLVDEQGYKDWSQAKDARYGSW